jgi:hypothetical protein
MTLLLSSSEATFTCAVADAFCIHDISSCSMYATPTIRRPSECETLLRASRRQEMRSLSPGREMPLRTSAKNVNEPKDSELSAPTLHQSINSKQAERRENGLLGHFSSLSRAIGRIVRLGLQLRHQLDE